MKKQNWTDAERDLLREHYPNNYTSVVAALLNRRVGQVYNQASVLGLKKSDAFIKKELQRQAERLREAGASYRFAKGTTPPNKGRKQTEYMSAEAIERTKGTRFITGQPPHNSLPDFTEVTRKDKAGKPYIMIKAPGERKLKYKHIWLWEKENKTLLPKGYNIVFKDGNTQNITIDNLECISNAELMVRNTIHRYPTEIKSVIRLSNKLKRTINAKKQN